MRNLKDPDIDKYRLGDWMIEHYGWEGDETQGAFLIATRDGNSIRIIATSGLHWDHVSVSLADRCPTWEEMSMIHRLFFKPEEVAMQLHVPLEDHKNVHPYCLHLWRPHAEHIPRPPADLV